MNLFLFVFVSVLRNLFNVINGDLSRQKLLRIHSVKLLVFSQRAVYKLKLGKFVIVDNNENPVKKLSRYFFYKLRG